MTEDGKGRVAAVRTAVTADDVVLLVAEDVADMIESVGRYECLSAQDAALAKHVVATVAQHFRDMTPVWRREWVGPRAALVLPPGAPRLTLVRTDDRPDK